MVSRISFFFSGGGGEEKEPQLSIASFFYEKNFEETSGHIICPFRLWFDVLPLEVAREQRRRQIELFRVKPHLLPC